MRFPRTGSTKFMQATLWPRGLGIISHDSALDLWELCDVNPARIHLRGAEGGEDPSGGASAPSTGMSVMSPPTSSQGRR